MINNKFLNIGFLIIGILLIEGYHISIFGDFWNVSILVVGIMFIVWSQLFLIMN